MIAPKSLHWHVLGAGAIGSLLASQLHQAGLEVSLLARTRDKADIFAGGLRVETHHGVETYPIPCHTLAETSALEALIITTKAYDAASAFKSVQHRLTADAPVILLVNGLGVYEQLLELHTPQSIFCGSTTEGAYFKQPAHLVYAGQGKTYIGRTSLPQQPGWFQNLATPNSNICWNHNIEQTLWHKLIINAAINPLSAIHQCENGALVSDPALFSQLQTLCQELAALSLAQGFEDFADNTLELVQNVALSTAGNRSSMLQDIEAGRPTEIDFINGYLCQIAQRNNLICTLNQELWRTIKTMETTNLL